MLRTEPGMRNVTPMPLMETWTSPKNMNQKGCIDHLCHSVRFSDGLSLSKCVNSMKTVKHLHVKLNLQY